MHMFGRDNLAFIPISMPKKKKFDNVCLNLNIKKLTKCINLLLQLFIHKL